MVRKSGKTYFAVAPFHYSDGVLAKGESAVLDDSTAAPGIASGALVESPAPKSADDSPSEPEE